MISIFKALIKFWSVFVRLQMGMYVRETEWSTQQNVPLIFCVKMFVFPY